MSYVQSVKDIFNASISIYFYPSLANIYIGNHRFSIDISIYFILHVSIDFPIYLYRFYGVIVFCRIFYTKLDYSKDFMRSIVSQIILQMFLQILGLYSFL